MSFADLFPWLVIALVAIEAFVLGYIIGWNKGFSIGRKYEETWQVEVKNRVKDYWKK